MPQNISVTAGSNFSMKIMVADPDSDNLTLSLTVSFALQNSSLSLRDSHLEWQVGRNFSGNLSFSVIATDVRGAQAAWSPVILICDCHANANCDFTFATATSSAGRNWYEGVCQCPSGFGGDKCQQSVCDSDPSPCFANGTCSISSNGSFTCSPCPEQMVGDGVFCERMDSCTSGSSVCEHECVTNSSSNTGFTCTCRTGFRVSNSDFSRCDDVNECSTNLHNCKSFQSQTCVNTIGSFRCVCPDAQVINSVGNCEYIGCNSFGINPCSSDKVCVGTQPGYRCISASGSAGRSTGILITISSMILAFVSASGLAMMEVN